jgi:hypothetical protein
MAITIPWQTSFARGFGGAIALSATAARRSGCSARNNPHAGCWLTLSRRMRRTGVSPVPEDLIIGAVYIL